MSRTFVLIAAVIAVVIVLLVLYYSGLLGNSATP